MTLNKAVLTSGKPSKGDRPLPIGPGEKLIVYQPQRKVMMWMLTQETGQQFHIVRLPLGRVREHKVSAR